MGKVVRIGVFETNSSSSHSITIVGGDFIPDRIPIDVDGVCRIYGGEFGWGVERFHDAATKASYCATYAREDPEQLGMLAHVVKEVTGVEVAFADLEDAYIDHQSDKGEGDICAEAFASAESLRAFIFNPKSMLLIDNDNH